MEVHNGMALINDRSIPFQLAANDLGVVITYGPPTVITWAKSPAPTSPLSKVSPQSVRSKLDLSLEVAMDAVDLKALHFTTEKTHAPRLGKPYSLCPSPVEVAADGTVDLAE